MKATRRTFTATENMIGKFLNLHLYTDINPIGKIVGIKSKTVLLIQPIKETKNNAKMEFISGGFAGHCVNQHDQDWGFEEYGDVREHKMYATDRSVRISDNPIMYYDFNF